MLDLLKIGSFILEMRKDKGLTQKQLADMVGVSDKAVSRWETGKGLPDTSTMPMMSLALTWQWQYCRFSMVCYSHYF